MKNIIIGIVILLGVYIIVQNIPSRSPESRSDSEDIAVKEFNQEISNEEEMEPTEVRVPTKFTCVGEYCDGSMNSDSPKEDFTVLQIPLVRDGGSIGCGADIFFAPHAVTKTMTPLNATYRLLFDLKPVPEIPEDNFRNVVGVYDRLFYDRVNLDKGTAHVYLTGSLYGPGHCSLPELRAQISQAALHFDTVDTVKVYLNGEVYDWCEQDLSDGEGPCPENPQLWVDSDNS